jgi:hypothetical protein
VRHAARGDAISAPDPPRRSAERGRRDPLPHAALWVPRRPEPTLLLAAVDAARCPVPWEPRYAGARAHSARHIPYADSASATRLRARYKRVVIVASRVFSARAASA